MPPPCQSPEGFGEAGTTGLAAEDDLPKERENRHEHGLMTKPVVVERIQNREDRRSPHPRPRHDQAAAEFYEEQQAYVG